VEFGFSSPLSNSISVWLKRVLSYVGTGMENYSMSTISDIGRSKPISYSDIGAIPISDIKIFSFKYVHVHVHVYGFPCLLDAHAYLMSMSIGCLYPSPSPSLSVFMSMFT
jgi:hypothetical protein